MKISAIIAFKSDWDRISATVCALVQNVSPDEIIIVNDGSKWPSNDFKPFSIHDLPIQVAKYCRVLDISISYGIGYAFDRGVSIATGDVLVLMGSDVLPYKEASDIIRNEVYRKPETIGCCASVGKAGVARYGADLLVTMDIDDLPKDSKLRKDQPNYRDLFKAKWLTEKKSDDPYEIPCLLGAFYFCTKDYYNKLGGFDSQNGNRWRGHKQYGHLEPHLSLKSWLAGDGCVVYPDLLVEHVFGHEGSRFARGSRSGENIWWNALWIGETMVLDASQRKQILEYPFPSLNYNMARKMIRRHYDQVEIVRQKNEGLFKRDLQWYLDKFHYKIG